VRQTLPLSSLIEFGPQTPRQCSIIERRRAGVEIRPSVHPTGSPWLMIRPEVASSSCVERSCGGVLVRFSVIFCVDVE
jgi:hypothetical protein